MTPQYDMRGLTVLTLALAFAPTAPSSPEAAREPTRILFIGNSLTYANELPALVQALGRGAGKDVTCAAIARPDVSLDDHWNQGEALKAIRQGGWSFVVLQQGPSALPESQVMLRASVKRFDAEIRKAGARTAMYMVWPARSRAQDFDGVSRSYAAAAGDVGGILLPAGDAWRAAWKRDASLALYSSDGFHPSPAGTYLAALVILQRLLAVAPSAVQAPGIDPKVADLLRQAASGIAASEQ